MPIELIPTEAELPEMKLTGIPSDLDLERKYSNFKGLELVGARMGFEMTYVKLAQPFLDQKMAEGDYVVEYKQPGEEFGSSVTREMWPGDVGPTERVRLLSLDNGVVEVQKATVYPNEFPLLTELHAERAWLRKKANEYLAKNP